MKKKTDKEVNKILELYKTGLTGAAIARQLGFERHAVCKILKNHNLVSNMYVLTPEKELLAKELCEQHKSATYISKTLGVSISAIHRYKKIHGYETYDNTVIKGETEKLLLSLYAEGKTDAEIANVVGVTSGAIWFYRKAHKLKSKFKHSDLAKINNTEFERLFKLGYTDKQIAEQLHMSPDGIYSHRMRHGYLRRNYNVNLERPLTQFQTEVLIGTVLGDASLTLGKNTINPRFTCAHGPKQKDLAAYKCQIFESIGAKLKHNIRKTPDKRNGKYYETYVMECPNNPALLPFWKAFYQEKKIIPFNLLDNFTAVSLAFMFMDDGYKTQSGYGIATNCFSTEELVRFQQFLKNKFNLTTSLHKNNQIYIKSCSRDLFTSLVKPYIVDCVKYKLHNVS